MLDQLPNELILNVLSHVDPKDLLLIRLASRFFCRFVLAHRHSLPLILSCVRIRTDPQHNKQSAYTSLLQITIVSYTNVVNTKTILCERNKLPDILPWLFAPRRIVSLIEDAPVCPSAHSAISSALVSSRCPVDERRTIAWGYDMSTRYREAVSDYFRHRLGRVLHPRRQQSSDDDDDDD